MPSDRVWVWMKGKHYARWNYSEPTLHIHEATYFVDEHTAREEGAELVSKGYELVQVPRRLVTGDPR